jgi:predicted dehydrogenase
MIKAALIGAGNRGMFAYGSYALKRPDEVQFVAVAEPDDGKRERFSTDHRISQENQYRSWEEMLA